MLDYVQVAIVLGRFSGQNALWEWQLRGIETMPEWRERKPVNSLYRLREHRETIVEDTNEPRFFEPSWAFRQHRQWWAHRAISFPWFFGTVYGLFLLWGLTQVVRASTLIFTPLYTTAAFFEKMVMPRSLSRSLLSIISSPVS